MKHMRPFIPINPGFRLTQPGAVAALLLTLAAVVRSLQVVWLSPLLTITSNSLAIAGAAIVGCRAFRSKTEHISVNYWLTAYLFVCILSIAVNRPHPAFLPWPQLAMFAAMIAAIGPLLTCRSLERVRVTCWKSVIRGGYCLVLASAIVYAAEYLQSGCILSAVNNYNGLTGISVNGMTLSPVAALVSIDALWQMLHREQRKWRILYGLMFIIATLVCVRSGSRMAIVGCGIATTVIFIMERKALFCYRRYILASLAIVLLAIVLMPDYFCYAVIHKFRIAIEHGTLIFSRSSLWADRMNEFLSSPLIGVGFHAFTQATSEFSPEGWTPAMGALEPGSSWLTILSQTGLAGAITLGVWLVIWFTRSYRHRETYWLPILLFLLTNGISEGWLTYSGSFLFMTFWLAAGITHHPKSHLSNF